MRAPGDVGYAEGLRFGEGWEAFGEKEEEEYIFRGILMEDDVEDVAYTDGDTEFFLDFALQGVLGRLVWFDFSAGEFPETCHVGQGRALGHEDFLIFDDDSSGDDDGHGSSFAAWASAATASKAVSSRLTNQAGADAAPNKMLSRIREMSSRRSSAGAPSARESRFG